MDNVIYSLDTTDYIRLLYIKLRTVSEKLFADVILYGECFTLKCESNMSGNILLKALRFIFNNLSIQSTKQTIVFIVLIPLIDLEIIINIQFGRNLTNL